MLHQFLRFATATLILAAACSESPQELLSPQPEASDASVSGRALVSIVNSGPIVFRARDGVDDDIFVVNPDGSELRNLTNDSEFNDWSPKWSPNGHMIAFSSNRAGAGAQDIYLMNANGSGLVALTETSDMLEGMPAWSPNGRQIAFSAFDGEYTDLYIMSSDGSNIERITTNGRAIFPSWSPDGKRIAFEATDWRPSFMTQAIWVVDVDGSNEMMITPDFIWGSYPAWSADGRTIAFSGAMPGDGAIPLYSVKPDGSDPKRMTSFSVSDAGWSPNGRSLVVSGSCFCIIDLAGSVVLDLGIRGIQPDWSRGAHLRSAAN